MIIQFQHKNALYQSNLSKPLDISIPLVEGEGQVNCFYAPFMSTSPVVAGDFIGSTTQGGPLNFLNVKINPHGNGTHTECVGHIAKKKFTINQCLKQFWYIAELITVAAEHKDEDKIITLEGIKQAFPENKMEVKAIIIRTSPNPLAKKNRLHSGTNPPYMEHEAIHYLNEKGIDHLLIDLPSVDREEDGGLLLSHKAFWGYPNQIQSHKTITELIYVPDNIRDGNYLLNIQTASFEIDVSPSKPILYDFERLYT